MVALQRLGEARARHHLGVQAFGRHEQDREVGGERRRHVLGADRLRLDAQALGQRLARARRPRARPRARALPAAAAIRRAETWRRPAASTAATRCRARAGGSRTRRAVRCRESVSTLVAYCCGVSTSASSAASCTSPHMPRVLTLASTRFRSPTPTASDCISPSPRCTCSRRSDTMRNDSPSRCSSVAAASRRPSRASARASPRCRCASRRGVARPSLRTASRRCSLDSVSLVSCSPKRPIAAPTSVRSPRPPGPAPRACWPGPGGCRARRARSGS